MKGKKVFFDEKTKIIKVIEPTDQDDEKGLSDNNPIDKRDKRLAKWLPIIIAVLTVVLTYVGVRIGQKNNDLVKEQVEIEKSELELNTRKFDAEKQPQFSISVESEDSYDENTYKSEYRMWLYDNDIKNFFNWQYENWLDGKLEYDFDPYEFLSEEEIVNNLLTYCDVWRFNRYVHDSDTAKYFSGEMEEEDIVASNSVFWNAYNKNDLEKLSLMTNGEFDLLKDEYVEYLSSTDYISFESWKSKYKYETQKIVIENTGAHINNASLKIHIFNSYTIYFDDTRYSFGIDMDGQYLSEYYCGGFTHVYNEYNTQTESFVLEFETSSQYVSAEYREVLYTTYDEYQRLRSIWETASSKLEEIATSDTKIVYVIDQPIYFSICYNDIEQDKQCDWYRYDPVNHTLSWINAINPSIDEPDILQYEFMDLEYFAACSAYASKCLGYSNSQYKNIEWFDDESYLELAEEKLLADIDSLFQ